MATITKETLPDGRIRWRVRYDMTGADGKRRQRKETYHSQKEAKAAAARAEAARAEGTLTPRSSMTLSELLAFWMENVKRSALSPGAYHGFEVTCRLHIGVLAHTAIQKLSAAQIQSHYAVLHRQGVGQRSIVRVHEILLGSLKYAVQVGWLSRSPMERVDRPKWTPKEMQTWTTDEAKRFLAHAQHDELAVLWQLALATGMRRGELLGLRWGDIDWSIQTLQIRQTIAPRIGGGTIVRPPKSATSRRTLHLPAPLVMALRAHRQEQNTLRLSMGDTWKNNDLVFPRPHGEPWNPSSVGHRFTRLVQQARIKRIRFHDMRHSYATIAIAMGLPLKAVSETLGHHDIQMTLQTYTHVLPAQRVQVAEAMGEALFDTGVSDMCQNEQESTNNQR